MEDKYAIKVDNVNKSFKLPNEKQSSIKGALVSIAKGNKGYEEQQVLKDISFQIEKGDFFGIVGRNGSGKSTLLKLLAGIYSPDSGTIHVNGKITPFIELGVGFNPELTGRENVYLNGALLGFNRKEMLAMYDEIVEFAEIDKFMDQKLKNYSSGMQVRLAFSIAIQAKSEILILDEVLAVGDEAFQQKCIDVFETYKANKQTIVLVTHDMSVVERFCNRALMLKDGDIVKIGSPREVAHMYSETNKNAYTNEQLKAEEKLYSEDIDIAVLDSLTLHPKKRFTTGEIVAIRLRWKRKDIQNAGVAIMKQSGEYVFGPNTYQDKITIDAASRELLYYVKADIGDGSYYVKAGLFGKTDSDVLEFVDEGPKFKIESVAGKPVWGGIAHLNHSWKVDDVEL